MRRFEFVSGTSSKFWEISQNGSEVMVHFGRIGTKGQMQTKDLGSWDTAAERVRNLVHEKLREGYTELGGEPSQDLGRGYVPPPVLPPYEPPQLPNDGPLTIGGASLPPGRRLEGDPVMAPPGVQMVAGSVIWATDGVVADAGRVLAGLRTAAGNMNLVPVLLAGLSSEPSRPWDSHEFAPTDPRRIDSFDAAAELAHAWAGSLEDSDEESDDLKPFGREFPGLANPPVVAPPSGFLRIFTKPRDPADDSDVLAAITGRRLALVAATRAADMITAIGWSGATNVHNDPAPMSAVLRHWEDLWMARVVEIGFDTLTLTVGSPPSDEKTALALAAEHFAFCPDNVWQGEGSITTYSRTLLQSRRWDFWWD
jgi:predicted DNA-binding WGR domain protein